MGCVYVCVCACMCVMYMHISTTEHCFVIREENPATWDIWMKLEGIMLSEIHQAKKNTLQYHLFIESKMSNS